MKVGDLVMLSSYGIVREYNGRITMVDPHQVGIIVKYKQNHSYPYKVRWSQYIGNVAVPSHTRRELKYAKIQSR